MSRTLPFICLALVIAIGIPFPSIAGTERLKQGQMEDLSHLGIAFRPFDGFINSPLPLPVAARFRDAFNKSEFEGYRLNDLWIRSQNPVRYNGKLGRITVAELRYDPITRIKFISGDYVTQESYDTALRTQSMPKAPETIRTWIETFTGKKISRADSKVEGLHVSFPYSRFLFEGADSTQSQAFVLRMAKGSNAPLLFLHFQFRSKSRIINTSKAVNLCLNSLRAVARTGDSVARDHKFQNKKILDNNATATEEHASARQRVIDNIKRSDGWWFVETPNFVITSNLTKKNRRLVDLIQKNIETIRRAYESLVPALEPIKDVSVVRIFNTRREYVAYVGPKLQWTGGIWHPGRKELVISPSYFYSKKENEQSILSTVYHEGFHQYLYYALNKRRTPAWFNEGHAGFFEACDIVQGIDRLTVGEHTRHVDVLKEILNDKTPINFERLLMMTYSEFYKSGDSKKSVGGHGASRNYTLAWAFVYFLRKGSGVMEDAVYRQIVNDVDNLLASGKTSRKAIANAIFRRVSLDKLEEDFVAFWTRSSRRARARQNHLFR